jgi:hypothetical protein
MHPISAIVTLQGANMRPDIIDRVRSVIIATTEDRRRLKQLEEETGIPDRNWKQVWSRRQRPTAHMIEALARRWPHYAFWLATGLTDPSAGHTAPGKAWTASQRTASGEVSAAAAKFFDACVLTQDVAYGLGDAPEQTEEAKPAQKYKDLDEAIFQLAFQRRLEHLKNQFQDAVDVAGETWKLRQLVAQLDVERIQLALKDSEEFARMFSTPANATHDVAE